MSPNYDLMYYHWHILPHYKFHGILFRIPCKQHYACLCRTSLFHSNSYTACLFSIGNEFDGDVTVNILTMRQTELSHHQPPPPPPPTTTTTTTTKRGEVFFLIFGGDGPPSREIPDEKRRGTYDIQLAVLARNNLWGTIPSIALADVRGVWYLGIYMNLNRCIEKKKNSRISHVACRIDFWSLTSIQCFRRQID